MGTSEGNVLGFVIASMEVHCQPEISEKRVICQKCFESGFSEKATDKMIKLLNE